MTGEEPRVAAWRAARRRDSGTASHRGIPLALVQAANEGLVALDQAGCVVWANYAAERLFAAKKAAALKGMPLSALVPGAADGAAADGSLTAWLIGRSEAWRPIAAEAHPLSGASVPVDLTVWRVPGQGVAAFVAVVRDATRLRKLEGQARFLRTHFRQVVETAAEAIISTDDDGNIILFNPAAEAMFGYATDEVTGESLDVLMPERFRSRHGSHIADFAATANNTRMMGDRGVIVGLRRDGTEFPAEASISRLTVRGRTVFNAVLRDRTEAERDAAALRAAQAQAEMGLRAKTAFLANASHELRTPLNAIIGFADLIVANRAGIAVSDTLIRYAEVIRDSGWHLRDLVDDILEMSRIDSGDREVVETDVDVCDLIDGCTDAVRTGAVAAGVALTSGGGPEGCRLRGDAPMLRKAVTCLVQNAVKFTPAGGAVSVSAGCESGGCIRIVVSDTGVGIAPEDHAKVVLPFTQADDTASRRYGGLGLGLPLAKALIGLHGGTLYIESEPDRGTAVSAVFPPERHVHGN